MNTTDIRETKHGQSVFWMAAVPMTSIVLTAALVYGYKWDETVKFASRLFSSRRGGSSSLYIAVEDTIPLLQEAGLDSRKDTFRTQSDGAGMSNETTLPRHWAGLVRRHRKDQGGGIPRRRTGESFF